MNDNGKFWKGFLIGLASSLAVVSVAAVFIGFLYLGSSGSSSLGNKISGNASSYDLDSRLVSGEYEKTELDSARIQYKLQYLQNVVDKYYLFDEDAEKAEEMLYTGFLAGMEDPYTSYYNKEDYKAMLESSSGTYYGIGVMVQQNQETGVITVVRVFSGSPALESGILPGDTLTKVEDTIATGTDLNKVVSILKGGEGTNVAIQIYRPSEEKTLELSVERRQVEVDTVLHQMLEGDIGYIQLMEFDEVTYSQVMSAYEDLSSQGMKGLIIDLRGNPGGLITSATDILDEFLPEGVIVYTKDKNGKGQEYNSDPDSRINEPLVVLVDENSASASELFASAIRDYERGTIVGTTTFGKGILQVLMPLGDGSAIKVTSGNFFTKSDYLIHENGVPADVEVELLEELKTKVEVLPEEDNQIQKGIEVIKEEIGN